VWLCHAANDFYMQGADQLQEILKRLDRIESSTLSTKTVLKPEEAASYIGVTLSTLYKLTSAGVVPFSKPNGRLIYFSREALDEWLLGKSTSTPAKREIKSANALLK
jgi:excisionase family DNA binding protein